MKDVQDMTDDEYRVHLSRQRGAGVYRSEGYEEFARRVEQGLEDHCNPVRMARFFLNLPDTGVRVAAE